MDRMMKRMMIKGGTKRWTGERYVDTWRNRRMNEETHVLDG